MDLKENLSQLCDIRKEIKELETKIEKLEPKTKEIISDSVNGSSPYFPYVETHYKIEGLDLISRKKLESLKNILKERHDKLLEIQITTEQFIDKLPTSRLRRIFTYRYIDDLSWIKIANLIDNSSTSESVRKEHDRFIEKNKLCPICPKKI